MRTLVALLSGIAGALIAGALIAMAAAALRGPSHGPIGGVVGLIAGFGLGWWLSVREHGRWAGPVVVWLWVGVALIATGLGFVVISSSR